MEIVHVCIMAIVRVCNRVIVMHVPCPLLCHVLQCSCSLAVEAGDSGGAKLPLWGGGLAIGVFPSPLGKTLVG